MARDTLPKITWDTSFANTLNFRYPLDAPIAYAKAVDGSEWVKSPAGVIDSWIIGWEYILEGQVRWIPPEDTTVPFSGSGWSSTDGWQDFLIWAAQGNEFRFYPDKDSATYITSYLYEPENITPQLEVYGERRLSLKIYNTSTEYTGY